MMYSSTIFKSNHADEKTALIGTILIGAITVDGIYSYSLVVDGKLLLSCYYDRFWKKTSHEVWNFRFGNKSQCSWNVGFVALYYGRDRTANWY